MALITLAQARETLWQFAGTVDYAEASPAQKRAFDAKLNQVVERYLGSGKPSHTVRRVTLPVYDGLVTLPRNFQTILGARLQNESETCGCSPLLTAWTAFHAFMNSPWWDECCDAKLSPRNQMAQTFIIPDGPFYLRCVATEVTENLTLVGGTDQNDDQIFSDVLLAITNGTTTTTQQYNTLPQLQKPLTSNKVLLYSVAVATGTATLIAIYAPGETVPAYPQFAVPDIDGYDSVLALCKLAYVPAIAETDVIIPGVWGALKKGLQAIVREDQMDDNPETGHSALWAQGWDILDKDRQELDGDSQIATLNVLGTFGADVLNPV